MSLGDNRLLDDVSRAVGALLRRAAAQPTASALSYEQAPELGVVVAAVRLALEHGMRRPALLRWLRGEPEARWLDAVLAAAAGCGAPPFAERARTAATTADSHYAALLEMQRFGLFSALPAAASYATSVWICLALAQGALGAALAEVFALDAFIHAAYEDGALCASPALRARLLAAVRPCAQLDLSPLRSIAPVPPLPLERWRRAGPHTGLPGGRAGARGPCAGLGASAGAARPAEREPAPAQPPDWPSAQCGGGGSGDGGGGAVGAVPMPAARKPSGARPRRRVAVPSSAARAACATAGAAHPPPTSAPQRRPPAAAARWRAVGVELRVTGAAGSGRGGVCVWLRVRPRGGDSAGCAPAPAPDSPRDAAEGAPAPSEAAECSGGSEKLPRAADSRCRAGTAAAGVPTGGGAEEGGGSSSDGRCRAGTAAAGVPTGGGAEEGGGSSSDGGCRAGDDDALAEMPAILYAHFTPASDAPGCVAAAAAPAHEGAAAAACAQTVRAALQLPPHPPPAHGLGAAAVGAAEEWGSDSGSSGAEDADAQHVRALASFAPTPLPPPTARRAPPPPAPLPDDPAAAAAAAAAAPEAAAVIGAAAARATAELLACLLSEGAQRWPSAEWHEQLLRAARAGLCRVRGEAAGDPSARGAAAALPPMRPPEYAQACAAARAQLCAREARPARGSTCAAHADDAPLARCALAQVLGEWTLCGVADARAVLLLRRAASVLGVRWGAVAAEADALVVEVAALTAGGVAEGSAASRAATRLLPRARPLLGATAERSLLEFRPSGFGRLRLRRVSEGRGLEVLLCVSGFCGGSAGARAEAEGEPTEAALARPWRALAAALGRCDVWCLEWDEQAAQVGASLPRAAAARAGAAGGARSATALLPSALSAPQAVRAGSAWTTSLARAKLAGAHLADLLEGAVFGRRPVSLIGFSLGARVVFSCCAQLAERGARGALQDVALLGAAATSKAERWERVWPAVAGRLVNAYSTRDTLLRGRHRWSHVASPPPAGAVAVPSLVVENVDVTAAIGAEHGAYEELAPALLREQLHVPPA